MEHDVIINTIRILFHTGEIGYSGSCVADIAFHRLSRRLTSKFFHELLIIMPRACAIS